MTPLSRDATPLMCDGDDSVRLVVGLFELEAKLAVPLEVTPVIDFTELLFEAIGEWETCFTDSDTLE